MFSGCNETLAVLIQTKIGEVHVQIFDVLIIGLFVVVRAEPGKAFVAEVGFDGVYALDHHVYSTVKLLLVQD